MKEVYIANLERDTVSQMIKDFEYQMVWGIYPPKLYNKRKKTFIRKRKRKKI